MKGPLAILAALLSHPVAADPQPHAISHARPGITGTEVFELDALPPRWWVARDERIFARSGLFAEDRRRDIEAG